MLTAGTLRTTYRIEVTTDPQGQWWTVHMDDATAADHDLAEANYERLREENPASYYRMVMVHEHIERNGRGRVYL